MRFPAEDSSAEAEAPERPDAAVVALPNRALPGPADTAPREATVGAQSRRLREVSGHKTIAMSGGIHRCSRPLPVRVDSVEHAQEIAPFRRRIVAGPSDTDCCV